MSNQQHSSKSTQHHHQQHYHVPQVLRNEHDIIFTNDEATCCKFVLYQLGYINDDYIKYMINLNELPNNLNDIINNPILIKGYYIRYIYIKYFIYHFIQKNKNKKIQIVNLGSGYDTLYFHICKEFNNNENKLLYLEIDYDQVIENKKNIIKYYNLPFKEDEYKLFSCDLKDINKLQNIFIENCDLNIETLFISELSLCYLDKNSNNLLINLIYNLFKENTRFIIYEPIIDINNKYGKQMLINLNKRNCPFLSLSITKEEQINRFKRDLNNLNIYINNLFEIYKILLRVDSNFSKVINKKHFMFDGIEEWEMIGKCYYFLYSYSCGGENNNNSETTNNSEEDNFNDKELPINVYGYKEYQQQ
ncbi:hypothetical protein ABK040_001417 [Willaertia magna]